MLNQTADDLLARWRAGDQAAAEELFRRYTNRLIALARSRLSENLARRLDPEDIVQSVYRSFFRDSRDGQYDCKRGGDLWQLLVRITLHKLQDQVRHHRRAKRAVQHDQTFGSEDSLLGLKAQALAKEPSPVEAVGLTEQLQELMQRLQPLQRQILEMRLQGYKISEIAAAVHRSQRTVIRILDEIKQSLAAGADDATP